MAQQEFDQPAFAGAEMAVDPAAGQSVQKSDRLLDEKFLEFVGGHSLSSIVNGHEATKSQILAIRRLTNDL
jgi:hypothetical protein